jgi:hypothetical protein
MDQKYALQSVLSDVSMPDAESDSANHDLILR